MLSTIKLLLWVTLLLLFTTCSLTQISFKCPANQCCFVQLMICVGNIMAIQWTVSKYTTAALECWEGIHQPVNSPPPQASSQLEATHPMAMVSKVRAKLLLTAYADSGCVHL